VTRAVGASRRGYGTVAVAIFDADGILMLHKPHVDADSDTDSEYSEVLKNAGYCAVSSIFSDFTASMRHYDIE
jgi:hypothetical protein